jgi:hypothetical protein
MSRSHSIKRVHAEMSESSRTLEQGQQAGLITGLGSGAPNKSIHFDLASFEGKVAAEQSEALAVRCLLFSPTPRKVRAHSADMLEFGDEIGGLCRSPAILDLQGRTNRPRNGAFDLVGVESNPGPASKAAKKAAAAILSASVQVKKKKKSPRKRGPNSSAGYGGFMNLGRSAMSNAVGPRVQGMNIGQTSVAAAYATGMGTSKPKFSRQTADSTRITHRELVGSLTGTVLFTLAQSFSVNPGLPATFPWLASQAVGWEKYKFNYLRLCSYTRTGSTTPGSIIMSPDYNAADPGPVTEQIMSSYYGTREDAPWKDICLEMDSARLAGERFLRYGALAPNLDIKTYDVANVFVGTVDGTAVAWSKLWWEYEVVFYNPQLPPGGLSDAGTLFSGGTVAVATPFGSLPNGTGPLGVSAVGAVVTLTGLTIGVEYIVGGTLQGTVLGNLTWVVTGLTAKTILSEVVNAAATSSNNSESFIATAQTATMTLTFSATTVTSTYFWIASYIPTPSL